AQSVADYWNREDARWDTAHPFSQTGRRVTLSDMNTDQLREWKAELNKRLVETISFFYSNFCLGVRRCVIDGIEPSDRASDSFQFEQFEYIYHQILRKDYDWVARDLLRAHFRENLANVEQHPYRYQDVGCL